MCEARVEGLRDEVGRVTSKRETLDGNITEWSYSYDDLGRLVEVTKSGVVVESYEYDSNGNRISTTSLERDINATASYTLADTIETFGNVAYVFDNDGYLKLKNSIDGNVTYTYSRTGELLKVEENNRTIEYTHDPLGRRISKTVDGVVIEKYLWLDRTTLLAVYDSNDNLVQRFNYSDDRMPNSMESNGVTYYLAYNQVGSLRVVSDSSGNIVKEISYDSFGNIITDTDPSFKVPFGFAGGLYDTDTNLTRFGYRDYDPNVGKWTARDPILFKSGSDNLYGYIDSDPINTFDKNGLWAFSMEGFYGWGGGVTFGQNPNGQNFLTVTLGYGLGGGVGFNSNGTSPGYNDNSNCPNPNVGVGVTANVGASVGPLNYTYGGKYGVNAGNNNAELYTDPSSVVGSADLTNGTNLKASGGINVGVQFTFYK